MTAGKFPNYLGRFSSLFVILLPEISKSQVHAQNLVDKNLIVICTNIVLILKKKVLPLSEPTPYPEHYYSCNWKLTTWIDAQISWNLHCKSLRFLS